MDSNQILLIIPKEEWTEILAIQKHILEQLKELRTKESPGVTASYITALEFMAMVNIKRTKFDELVQTNMIRIIKKKRKIYVPVTEIERYFSDPKIQ